MNRNEIKIKAWDKVKEYINLDDDNFNSCAYSFKISDDYNLAIWCDIDYEFDKNNPKYFIVSIRYNPYDDLFGDDISDLEWSTDGISKEELENVIDTLLDSLKNKKLFKTSQGYYTLIKK